MRRVTAVLLIVAVLCLSGCGFLRNTATPASRLEGHWFSDARVDYYFGFADEANRQGTLIIVDESGERVDQTYRILSEDIELGLVTVLYEGEVEREVTFYIPEDGIFMQERGDHVDPDSAIDYTFIDTRIEPAPSEETE